MTWLLLSVERCDLVRNNQHCDPVDCTMTGFPSLHHLPDFAQTHVHWVDDAIQPSHPLSPPFLLPLISPSIRVFSNESALCIRWPNYWSFSHSISPSDEHSGLTSFRMDWLDLLAVQGTLKRLLQHHHSKASILWHSAFFIVQLSHSYMITGKTIALTRRTFVDKVMSLLYVLSKFVVGKEMATHSSILPWRIPWTEEPGRPWSRVAESQRWLKLLSRHTR